LWFADKGSIPVNLSIHKTIPFVEDECISGIDTVAVIGGLSKLLMC
jgi:4'-phosphopantetheinyl transferase